MTLVIAERRDGIATLTLNRPARYNALSADLLAALQDELDALIAEPDLRCVVIAAAGKAFCAGHDLREMRAMDQARLQALFAQCSTVMRSLRDMPVPVIAKVQGAAVAAGCQLVAACDLAVAASSATFAVSGIDLGLFCSTPAVALSRNVPTKVAFDMLFTGRFIDAVEARDIGLVNAVAADAALADHVTELAATIGAKSPEGVRIGKAMFYAQRDMGLADAYAFAGATMARNMTTEDARGGIGAFLDKGRRRVTTG